MLKYPTFWNKISLISILLYPLTWLFRLASFVRKLTIKTRDLGYIVVCVGNATIGGTGKTPMIIEIAKYYLSHGRKLIILTKGYGGTYQNASIVTSNSQANIVGDEAIEIMRGLAHYEKAIVIVARSPLDALGLINANKPDLILVDDGMQNPAFKKDFSILMVDGIRGFGNGLIIPSGPLRESVSGAIARVDLVCSINPTIDTAQNLENIAPGKFIAVSSAIEALQSKPARSLAFCGLGNPARFFDIIRGDYAVAKEMVFPDHHNYSKEDISEINKIAESGAFDAIITSAKDVVKLDESDFSVKLYVARMKIDAQNIEQIAREIDEKFSQKL